MLQSRRSQSNERDVSMPSFEVVIDMHLRPLELEYDPCDQIVEVAAGTSAVRAPWHAIDHEFQLGPNPMHYCQTEAGSGVTRMIAMQLQQKAGGYIPHLVDWHGLKACCPRQKKRVSVKTVTKHTRSVSAKSLLPPNSPIAPRK